MGWKINVVKNRGLESTELDTAWYNAEVDHQTMLFKYWSLLPAGKPLHDPGSIRLPNNPNQNEYYVIRTIDKQKQVLNYLEDCIAV